MSSAFFFFLTYSFVIPEVDHRWVSIQAPATEVVHNSVTRTLVLIDILLIEDGGECSVIQSLILREYRYSSTLVRIVLPLLQSFRDSLIKSKK